MSIRYMRYIMLNVGGGQRVPRTDVADEAVDYLGPLLAEEGPHRLQIPGVDFDLVVRHEGPGLTVRVVEPGVTLAQFAVVPRDRGTLGAALWRRLHETALDRFATSPDEPPDAPWVGLALSAVTRERPRQTVHGIIALCKSAAWAWLDGGRDA